MRNLMEMPDVKVPVDDTVQTTFRGMSSLLLSEMLQFAERNVNFRNGRVDRVAYEVYEGEAVFPDDEDPEERSTTWQFSAHRVRSAGDRQEVNVTYVLSRTERRSNVGIPKHILDRVDCYEVNDEDDEDTEGDDEASESGSVATIDLAAETDGDETKNAMTEIGNTYTREREVEFTITTDGGHIESCEKITYIDEDDNKIHEVCSCDPDADEEVLYRRQHDPRTGILLDTMRQVPSNTLAERTENAYDVLTLDDPLAAAIGWINESNQIEEIAPALHRDRQYIYYVWARAIFKDTLQAFQRQFGG